MGLSVVLCLLASSLVAFFLYPRSVIVVDDGIHAVNVRFQRSGTKVLMNMTVGVLTFSDLVGLYQIQFNKTQFSSVQEEEAHVWLISHCRQMLRAWALLN